MGNYFVKRRPCTNIIEKHHQELAAVIVEPVQRILAPAPGFLESLRAITSYYNIPLIFDEVVTGFRMAYGGAQEFYGVPPDLTAVGNIMGGGFALGAVCGREDIMSVYDPSQTKSDSLVSQIGTPMFRLCGFCAHFIIFLRQLCGIKTQ